jgi:ABC-type nitrate/sulfonate/bicarbonate transport system ATPase subunit
VSDELIVLGNRPAQIIYQTDVVIPQEYRDPVQVRKSQNFQALFEQIWKLLSKEI